MASDGGSYGTLAINVIANTSAMTRSVASASQQAGQQAASSISSALSRGLSSTTAVAQRVASGVSGAFTSAANATRSALSTLASSSTFSALSGAASKAGAGISSVFTSATGAARTALTNLGATPFGQKLTQAASSAGSSLVSLIGGGASKAGAALSSLGGTAFTGLVTGAQKAGASIASALDGAMSGMTKAVGVTSAALAAMTLGKGFNRLVQIDQATFKLRGLGHSAETVTEVMDNALTSVKGTAFGMGDAASQAAVLIASGVKPGQDLTRTLKLVGDAATIAGAPMNEIGDIFSKVAAQGKVTAREVQMLTNRGIPALQLFGDALGVSSSEVSAMVTAGEVDFETFRVAIENGMGGAALQSGNTFTGALANVGAAIGRLGASFLGPAFEGIKPFFADLIKFLDRAGPAAASLGERFGALVARGVEMFRAFTTNEAGLSKVTGLFGQLSSVAGPLVGLLGASGLGQVKNLAGPFGSLVPAMNPLVGLLLGLVAASPELRAALLSLVPPLVDLAKAALPAFVAALNALLPVALPLIEHVLVPMVQALGAVARAFPGATGGMALFGVGLVKLAPLRQVTSGLLGMANGAGTAVPMMTKLGRLLNGALLGGVKALGAALMTPPVGIVVAIVAVVAAVVLAYKNFEPFRNVVDAVGRALLAVGKVIVGSVVGAFWAVVDAGKAALDWVTGLPGKIVALFTSLPGLLTGAVQGNRLLQIITEPFQGVIEVVRGIITVVQGIFSGDLSQVAEGVGRILGGLVRHFLALPKMVFEALVEFGPSVWRATVDALAAAGTWLVDAGVRLLAGLAGGITAGASAVWSFLTALPGTILSFLVNAHVWLAETGLRLLRGLLDGIYRGEVAVVNWLRNLPGMILGFLLGASVWLVDTGVKIVAGMASGLVSGAGAVWEFMRGLPAQVIGALGDASTWLIDAGRQVLEGLWKGISGAVSALKDKISGVAGSIVGGFKSALGISSPARAMLPIGGQVVEGISVGMARSAGLLDTAVDTLATDLAGADLTGPAVGLGTASDDAAAQVSAATSGIAAATTSLASSTWAPAMAGMSAQVLSFSATTWAADAGINAATSVMSATTTNAANRYAGDTGAMGNNSRGMAGTVTSAMSQVAGTTASAGAQVSGTFASLHNGLGSLAGAFVATRNAIAASWGQLPGTVVGPVRDTFNWLTTNFVGGFNTALAGLNIKLPDFPRLASGGVVPGNGGPRADDVLALLSSHEFVVQARYARDPAVLAQLQAINAGRWGGGYANGGAVFPVKGGRIGSPYGPRGGGFHGGVDVPASRGTPIMATMPGVVRVANMGGFGGGYGNYVRLAHAGGQETLSAHMLRTAVAVGAQVAAGQVIGYINNTGDSFGDHLHFELFQGGSKINPTGLLSGAGQGTPGGGLDFDLGIDPDIGVAAPLLFGPLAKTMLDELKGKAGVATGRFRDGLTAGVMGFLSPLVQKFVDEKDKSTVDVAPGGGGAVEQWRPLVNQVLGMLGQSAALADLVMVLIKHESNGNPNAINNYDVNAQNGIPSQGLMQVIPPTFAANAGPFRDRKITDPLANIYAGVNYGIKRYGSVPQIRGIADYLRTGKYTWYDEGGWLPPGASLVVNQTGRPEPILSPRQWQAFESFTGGGGGFGGDTETVALLRRVARALERGTSVSIDGEPVAAAVARHSLYGVNA